MPEVGSFRMPRHPVPGNVPMAFSMGDETRATIQHWRSRFESTSASAALREMVAHAWEMRDKKSTGRALNKAESGRMRALRAAHDDLWNLMSLARAIPAPLPESLFAYLGAAFDALESALEEERVKLEEEVRRG